MDGGGTWEAAVKSRREKQCEERFAEEQETRWAKCSASFASIAHILCLQGWTWMQHRISARYRQGREVHGVQVPGVVGEQQFVHPSLITKANFVARPTLPCISVKCSLWCNCK